MRKKHQPGCPCCPSDECECSVTQVKITLSSNNIMQMLCGAAPIGGPCPYIEFTFDIDDIYYFSIDSSDISFSTTFYNTNGVQECDTGRYCAVLVFEYNSTRKESCRTISDIFYGFTMYIFWDPTKTKTTCPTLEDFEPDWSISSIGTTPDPDLRQVCEAIIEESYTFGGGNIGCPATALEVDMEFIIS